MSEAVRELMDLAHAAAYVLKQGEYSLMAQRIREVIATVESELNKSPAEQHQERIEELDLQWNR